MCVSCYSCTEHYIPWLCQDFLLASIFFIIIKPRVHKPLIVKTILQITYLLSLDQTAIWQADLHQSHIHAYIALFRCTITLILFPIIFYKSSFASLGKNSNSQGPGRWLKGLGYILCMWEPWIQSLAPNDPLGNAGCGTCPSQVKLLKFENDEKHVKVYNEQSLFCCQ